MTDVKDCSGASLPVYCSGYVTDCGVVEGAKPDGSVYKICVEVDRDNNKTDVKPRAGQFYMIRSKKSGVLLCRPISLYASSAATDTQQLKLEFVVLKKGKGTIELCNLRKEDEVDLIGPLGNYFEVPAKDKKVCIIGGGVGVAPVAGFASTLDSKSYDFYAAFKSGSYGLEHVDAANLYITTDDGSIGIKGMLSAALTQDKVSEYDVVYACGPTPMLAYVKQICDAAGVKCYLSLESKMACGLGACLGCTIKTTEGNKRCCKDGPVFDAKILDFGPMTFGPRNAALKQDEVDLSVELKGVKFSNPVIAASGTFGYGTEYASTFDVNELGGICSKGLTLEPKPGNTGIRLVETTGGLINSIGLENPGIQHFIDNEMQGMLKLKPVTIANLSGSSLEGYVKGAELLEQTEVPVIELNISCPNVKAGGMAFGMDCTAAATVVEAVRKVITKPLIVKLSPNAPDLIGVAMAVVKAGADAISLVNTFQATAINIETGRPVFDNIRAGFSGPAVKPIALRMVYDVCQAMNKLPEGERIPVIGLGGIATWQDAVEFIMAGAHSVQVGAATFADPHVMVNIVKGLKEFMARKGYKTIADFRGCAL